MAADQASEIGIGSRSMAIIAEWENRGLMSPERIMQRFDTEIQEHVFQSEADTIIENFNSLCTEQAGIKYLDEATFVSFLARLFPPSFSPMSEAGPVIYAMAVYLSRFPFFSQEQPLLTLQAILRDLTLMLPDRVNRWIDGSVAGDCLVSRQRTELDHLRLIFQSLADIGSVKVLQSHNRELAVGIPPRNAPDSIDFRALNNDADGDEMYHDILDVLSATQPLQRFQEIPVSRNNLRPLATKLWRTDVRLSQCHIPRVKLASLVKLMLSMHLTGDGQQAAKFVDQLPVLDVVTEHVVNAFSGRDEQPVTWPIFYSVMTSAAPFLLDPLYRLLNLFFKRPGPLDKSDNRLPLQDHILTSPLISQLNLVLADTITFDGIRRLYQCKPAHNPSSAHFAGLVSVLKTYSEPCIIIICGKTATADPFTLGAFLPIPEQQDATDVAKSARFVGSFLFQLAPTHDIFHASAGQPCWVLSADQQLHFGNDNAGVAIVLTDSLQEGKMLHKPAGEDVAYEANPRRGEWTEQFSVNVLEVWMERE